MLVDGIPDRHCVSLPQQTCRSFNLIRIAEQESIKLVKVKELSIGTQVFRLPGKAILISIFFILEAKLRVLTGEVARPEHQLPGNETSGAT